MYSILSVVAETKKVYNNSGLLIIYIIYIYIYILGGCPFNGPLSGMKYPTRTKSTTRRCIVVRSRSRSCGGGDPA